MTTNKTLVKELFFIRAFACVCVVLMHALQQMVRWHPVTPGETKVLNVLTAAILFSTPVFAFLSAFLLGHGGSKPGALWRRVQYLVFPFAAFALGYAVWHHQLWGVVLRDKLEYNLRGGYHGYFVLVVMQLFILFELVHPILRRAPAWVVLPFAGIINVGFLYGLNKGLITLPHWGFNWYHAFPAWIFYLALGYYAGRHRDQLVALAQRWWIPILGYTTLALGWLQFRALSGRYPDMTSQRYDVLLYAAGVILLLFAVAPRFNRVPWLVQVLSRYSFGIYLMHWFFLEYFWTRGKFHTFKLPVAGHVMLLSVAAIVASVVVAFVVSRLPLGSYLVGNVGPAYRQPEQPKAPPVAAEA